jgi:hypothetical protein
MANPFSSSSFGKNTFGVFSEPLDAGEYIKNKQAKAMFCKTYNCTPNIKVGSESNFILYKKTNYLKVTNNINKSNLNINLITKLDLTNVPVIQNFTNNDIPTTIVLTSIPYLEYNIDPSGNLFGNTICGINNYEKYRVPL